MTVKEKIKVRLDEVEKLMLEQKHLEAPELVSEKLRNVSKFWGVLSEDEKDYVNAVRYAIEDQLTWNP